MRIDNNSPHAFIYNNSVARGQMEAKKNRMTYSTLPEGILQYLLFMLLAVISIYFLYWINRKHKNLNGQIIRAIDIPVYILNKQGYAIRLLNNPTEKKHKLPPSKSENINIRDLIIDTEEAQKYMSLLQSVLKTRLPDSLTVKIRGDKELYISIRMVYLSRETVLAFIRNVTESKKLLEAKNKAEEANRLKSAFLANMSHEIRTPLNAIVGFSSLLSELSEDEEVKEYIHIIEENNELLLQLINDILDLSRIEAGLLEFIEGEMNVNDMFYEIQAASALKAPSQVNIRFSPEWATCIIHTVPNRIKQVINNYVSNALKHTDQGFIDIGYTIHNDNKIRFFVRDTGTGIPIDKQELIFERFTKLNSFKQGTGLGLSICAMIAEKMDGKVGVESMPGEGSEFWFEIPYVPAQEQILNEAQTATSRLPATPDA